MKFARAEEIVKSIESMEVMYNNTPVWIMELYPDEQTALISAGVFGEDSKTVPVGQLVETGRCC